MALVRDITDPSSRAQAMTRLVEVLAGAQEHDRAEHVTRDITEPFSRAWAMTGLVEALVGVDQPCSLWMDLAIRLLAEVTATSAWVVGVDLIARCAPHELQSGVDDAFGIVMVGAAEM
jgi:hypothetical protein